MHELEQILSVMGAGPVETWGRGNYPKPQILWRITNKPFFIKGVSINQPFAAHPPSDFQIFRGFCYVAGQLEFHLSAILSFAAVSAKSCQWTSA